MSAWRIRRDAMAMVKAGVPKELQETIADKFLDDSGIGHKFPDLVWTNLTDEEQLLAVEGYLAGKAKDADRAERDAEGLRRTRAAPAPDGASYRESSPAAELPEPLMNDAERAEFAALEEKFYAAGKALDGDAMRELFFGRYGELLVADSVEDANRFLAKYSGVDVAGVLQILFTIRDKLSRMQEIAVTRRLALEKRVAALEAGLGGKDSDISVSLGTDQRTLRFDFREGSVHKVAEVSVPWPVDRGVFKFGERYARGDGVSHRGSWWIAQEDTADIPGGTSGWRLAVKHGRDGKDAS